MKKNEPNSAYGFDFDPTYNGWVLARVKAPYEPSMMRFEPEICSKWPKIMKFWDSLQKDFFIKKFNMQGIFSAGSTVKL